MLGRRTSFFFVAAKSNLMLRGRQKRVTHPTSHAAPRPTPGQRVGAVHSSVVRATPAVPPPRATRGGGSVGRHFQAGARSLKPTHEHQRPPSRDACPFPKTAKHTRSLCRPQARRRPVGARCTPASLRRPAADGRCIIHGAVLAARRCTPRRGRPPMTRPRRTALCSWPQRRLQAPSPGCYDTRGAAS